MRLAPLHAPTACLCLLAVLSGCVARVPTTEIAVRDPGLVRVDMRTPAGAQAVLPEGATPTEGRFTVLGVPGVVLKVRRDADGALLAECDGCAGLHPGLLVPRRGSMVFSGLAAEVVRSENGELRWQIDLHGALPQGMWLRGVYVGTPFDAQVELATPLANVAAVQERQTRVGKDGAGSGVWGIVGGAVLTGLGTYALAQMRSSSANEALWQSVGLTLLTLGIPAMVLGVVNVATPSEERHVLPLPEGAWHLDSGTPP